MDTTAAGLLSHLSIDCDRLIDRIERLAKIGQQPTGSIRRLAFTPEDLQARYLVQQWMNEVGMTVRIDAAGNLIGRYAGTIENAPALATGSHIDTVPSGGQFDGVLGVLAGIEIVHTLHEQQIRLQHPLEVIVFTDEESSMIGCQAIAGTVLTQAPDRYQPSIGRSIQDCLDTIGGNWTAITTAQQSRSEIAAFIELHVEQGIVLEHQQTAIGVVEGVVGMQRHKITITGQANHAGTTPMHLRQDALVAAAHIILAVQKIAHQMPSHPVATVGYLEVSPNAVNIIPGKVELSVDLRDLSSACLNDMMQQLKMAIEQIATTTQTTITTTPLLCVEPSLAAKHIQTTIANICQQLDLSYCSLPSRAGHDALEMGRLTDMGMIFVPSQSGISHSGAEYTSPEHCVQGANVLLHTLLALDQFYPDTSSALDD
ncbi:Zn-dependent hydrolase [Pantanalinema sp. GBBB05]|uniref:Zn-dependent hydrolase n=1 Tax=Pantanalinema sp. GBBB05 TaxID=2604139 RepID=UPI001DBA27FD|nr:Zn-dependent hydrolase [Pantanalinema sp. GBBB05]